MNLAVFELAAYRTEHNLTAGQTAASILLKKMPDYQGLFKKLT